MQLAPSTEVLRQIAVMIPAREPDARLPPLVEALTAQGFGAIVVVDDGSSAACAPIFAALERISGVRILRHAVNRGKGRALRTGIDYLLTELPGMSGVVTADADGQHVPADIIRVAEALGATGEAVLGVRRLLQDAPLRSRFGNALTRRIFAWAIGVELADTQTGLRGFPQALLPELLMLPGERYEYEMAVLAHLCRSCKPVEVPIEAVYFAGNSGSHFRPLVDSLRIGWALLRS